MSQSPEALRARAARRRHLQQRQTVIFGTLIAGLIVIALVAGAMWSGVLPSPVNVPLYSGGGVASPTAVVPPCPPAGATPVAYSEIGVNVFNGTETSGLAARTAAELRDLGFQTGTEDNGDEYGGVARITTGPQGIAAAYTLASLFPSSQIVLDDRAADAVDLLLGVGYEALVPEDEITLDPDAEIPVPDSCNQVTTESATE